MSGLTLRDGIWHIDKQINGHRICESCGTSDRQEAEKYLIHKLEEIRKSQVYGIRPKRIFRDAAIKYLLENQHKRSIGTDAILLKLLDSFIGDLTIEKVHMGTLRPFILEQQKKGKKTKTINLSLGTVRRILNLAASEWLDEFGLSWLLNPPKISLLPVRDARKPYPLSWEEQDRFFAMLPEHLKEMALYKVNTGCREQEVCQLEWQWEIHIPELNTFGFLIPGDKVKNTKDRLVVLNEISKAVINRQRGKHPIYVFTYEGNPLLRMNNTGWQRTRKQAEIPVRVHDLKHTFGRRLRSAGVSFEDRQDLLGHKSGRITTHYSAAELQNLIDAANKVCERRTVGTLLKQNVIHANILDWKSRKSPAEEIRNANTCDNSICN